MSALDDAKAGAADVLTSLQNRFATLRTGSVTPSLLDPVTISMPEISDKPMKLTKIASVTPQGRTLVVTPLHQFKKAPIENAINRANLGLTAQAKEGIIYVAIPPLDGNQRKLIVKDAEKMANEAKIAMRQVRQDVNDGIKKANKDGDLTDNEKEAALDKVQKVTDETMKAIDKLLEAQTKKITTI